MPSTIITKNSITASAVPVSGDLVRGELALNLTDGRIYSRDEGTTIVELGINPSTIAITAGTINNAVIGATTAVAGTFTNLTATGTLTGTLATAAQPNITSLGTIASLVAGTGQFDTSLNVDGTATMDGLVVDGDIRVNTTGTASTTGVNLVLADTSNASALQLHNNVGGSEGGSLLYSSSASEFNVYNYTGAVGSETYVNRFGIASNGDISFFEDTGTTAKLFWDASAESLGIGTSSPTDKLTLDSGQMRLSDSYGIRWGSASTAIYGSGGAGTLQMYTNSSEAMRIDSAGNVLVGTTAVYPADSNVAGHSLTAVGQIQSSVSGFAAFVANRKTSDGDVVLFKKDGTSVGSVSVTASATAYNTSSDYRLKDITGSLQGSGAYIDSLNPVEGTWKADGSVFVGLIAHEADEVSRTPIATGEKDGEEMQGMSYSSSEMMANILAELQSLRKRVAELEA